MAEQVCLSSEKLSITSGVSKLYPKFIGLLSSNSSNLCQSNFNYHLISRSTTYSMLVISNVHGHQMSFLIVIHSRNHLSFKLTMTGNQSGRRRGSLTREERSRGKVEYLVKWKGYDIHGNQWLSVNQLTNARGAIRDFEESLMLTRLNALSTGRLGKSTQCSARPRQVEDARREQ